MTPAAAAGLVGEAGRAWFWKSLRWFHAAAFTPVLMVLMLVVGVQLTSGVVTDRTGPAAAVGTALPGVMLILVSCVAPVALFRLLAFVDPATPSGSAARAAWAASIGLNQIARLSGGHSGSYPDTTGASGDGSRSAGEMTATGTTESRVVAAETELLSATGGPAGAGVEAGVQGVESASAAAAGAGSDHAAASGVGRAADPPIAPAAPTPDAGQGAIPPAAVDPTPNADRPGSAEPPPTSPTPPDLGGTSPGATPAAGGAAADGAAGRAATVATRVPIVPA